MSVNLLQRKIVSGETEFSFGLKSRNFLVKNFGSNAVYVSFESPVAQATAIKIEGGSYQYCSANVRVDRGMELDFDKIYVSGSGEVEVQQILEV